MRSLFERFRKKESVRRICKVDKIKYERSKSMSDVLRPVYILSIIFGLRFFGFPSDFSRRVCSFLYSMSLYCLYIAGRFYWKHNRVIDLHETIFYMTTIIHHIVIIVILLMGLYRSKVSLKILYDILIFLQNFLLTFNKIIY